MADDFSHEEWRVVEEFPDYEVSSVGRIRALREVFIRNKLTGGMSRRWPAGRILKGTIDKDGYRRVGLLRNGKQRYKRIHILVCTAFHGERPSDDFEVAHWDGVKTNNHDSNLRWATSLENQADRDRHHKTVRGEKSHLTKLTDAQVKQILMTANQRGVAPKLAKQLGVSPDAIHHVWRGTAWGWLTNKKRR